MRRPESYLTQASKMQLQMIDLFMDAWQAQMKSPMHDQFVGQLQPYSTIGLGPISGNCASSALDGSRADVAAQLDICVFDVDRRRKSRSTKHAYCSRTDPHA